MVKGFIKSMINIIIIVGKSELWQKFSAQLIIEP